MLELEILNQAEKFLKKLKKSDLQIAKQLILKITELQKNPAPHNSTEIVNYYPFRRVKVNKYRIIYRYNEKNLYITIIEKRDVVYKHLLTFL